MRPVAITSTPFSGTMPSRGTADLPDDAGRLGALVLEREIDVAGGIALDLGHFAAHPHAAEVVLQRPLHRAGDLGDGVFRHIGNRARRGSSIRQAYARREAPGMQGRTGRSGRQRTRRRDDMRAGRRIGRAGARAVLGDRRQPAADESSGARPGNPGIAERGAMRADRAAGHPGLVAFAQRQRDRPGGPGPEAPLVAGITDAMEAAGIACCGPTRAAARLEGSKTFTKEICDAAGIPTALWERFDDADAARDFVRRRGAPIVVKADGLAAGKGVVVAATEDEAIAAIDAMHGRAQSSARPARRW